MNDPHQNQFHGKPVHTTVLQVMLASPSDVAEERSAFFRIVEEVNGILRDTDKSLRLEPITWERNTYPDAGLPQRVVIKQLILDTCDIFVGVFWTRFGTPTGETHRDDGSHYLSGTEQEIAESFEARRKNSSGRPTIMLYRKRDILPVDMNDDGQLQYARVIEFFKRTAPAGPYEALSAEFRGAKFGSLLRDHLLRAASDIEKSAPHLSEVKASDAIDPRQQWLSAVRMTWNPFTTITAEAEPDLEPYYLPIGEHRPQKLVREPRHWFLFGAPGCGKTTLARMVEPLCFPRKPGSEVLCVWFGLMELQHVLARQGGNPDVLDPLSFLSHLTKKADETIRTVHLQPSAGTGSTTLDKPLAALLASAGLKKLICVLDQANELPTVNGDPSRIVSLLRPILLHSFREPLLPQIIFRYFLPDTVEELLVTEGRMFRLDRCRVTHLTWSDAQLMSLLRQRVSQYADPPGSIQSLGQLCEPAHGFAARIELEIAKLAKGSPRAAIWLAGRLIDIHCQHPTPPGLIQESSWLATFQEWQRYGIRQFASALGDTFWSHDADIYFGERLVKLTPQNSLLMRALIEAGEHGCSKDELKQAGWPDDSPEGVTDRALGEATSRLRRELTKLGVDEDLVHTDHGRGYRLLRPQSAA